MLSSLFDQNGTIFAALGNIVDRDDIKSSMSPFHVLPDYRIQYPEVVIRALSELYMEYNRVFVSLVEANKEWDTDYQYCLQNGVPINFGVQIDMVGLPQTFLDAASTKTRFEVRDILRGQIFEIENSLAMYQLLEKISSNGHNSFFKMRFRSILDALRRQFGKPIALLAITNQKYEAMKASEFGKKADEPLSNAEVAELSGFDRFMGPYEFQQHVEENGGRCQYILYARTSDPITKLKKPDVKVDHPLLDDPEMRRIIKANILTFNIDDPCWPINDQRRINDTKEYMPAMGMAFPITDDLDLLSSGFEKYLCEQGVDLEVVVSGKTALRCKPNKGTYGCYGHVRGFLSDRKFRNELRRNMRQRGGYMVQLERQTPHIINKTDGKEYTFIDRNFFGIANGYPEFMGGFRNLIPVDSFEAHEARIHGNSSAVWAEITY